MPGRLFLVVGPSGVGKDTILEGARLALADDPHLIFAQRVITRPADSGGEDHHAVSTDTFAKMRQDGTFFAAWRAHGFDYGLPIELKHQLEAGRHVLANVSRAALQAIVDAWPDAMVIEIKADPEMIAARLSGRGREDAAAIKARLGRGAPPMPANIQVLSVDNNASIEQAVAQFVAVVRSVVPQPLKLKRVDIDTWNEPICFLNYACERYDARSFLGPGKVRAFNRHGCVTARVNLAHDDIVKRDEIGLSRFAFERLGQREGSPLTLTRAPQPASIEALRAKVGGESLRDDDIDGIIRDIVEGAYNGREIAAFLVSSAQQLDDEEVVALARARAKYAQTITWPYDLVVDKHSLGGVPGSRITLIVTPIVAAYGLVIPKTSSRAITSAAGTADVMEVVARVDLTRREVESAVGRAGGCIVWNGRLNHSAVDDVMNAMTRPLGVDSRRWSVASILSKKLAAGSTHIIIDIPAGRGTKIATRPEAEVLAELFVKVGQRLGLVVEAQVTEGTRPIGRGVGPALEIRDVYAVLRNADDAPSDLRDKALWFAGRILEWSPDIAPGAGLGTAEQILRSGAALAAFERIIDAQGRREAPDAPGHLVREICAPASGVIGAIDARRVSGIARRAGAPMDKGAGVDLVARVGTELRAGDVMYRVHASAESSLQHAVAYAEREPVVDLI